MTTSKAPTDIEKGESDYEYNSYYEEEDLPEDIDSNEVSVPDEIEDSESFEPGMSDRIKQEARSKAKHKEKSGKKGRR